MRILHTADWHIGQNFYDYDRREEHQIFFAWLKQQVKEQRVDVLLIAGDIFDSPNPSAHSQKMYNKLLRDLNKENPHLQTVVISGNHDSAARLEAFSPLLEKIKVTTKGVIERTNAGKIDYADLLVPLQQEGEIKAWIMAVPYLRQGDYPMARNYGESIALFYNELYDELRKHRKTHQAIIAMGHLQATGADLSADDRSERTVIGGLEAVPAETFDQEGIVYVALGHLHKSQRVAKREHIRYAGAPLPMSFSEKNYKQGANLIEIKDVELLSMKRLDFDAPVKLLTLPKEKKKLEGVLEEIANLPDGKVKAGSPYLEVKVWITEPEPSMRHRIEKALEGKSVRLARTEAVLNEEDRKLKLMSYDELKTINPIEIAKDLHQARYGNPMPATMEEILRTVIREIEE